MARKTTPTFIVELPLGVIRADAREMGVRLELGRQLYNACLGEGLRRLERLREGPAWAQASAMPRMKARKPNKERAAAFAAARAAVHLRCDFSVRHPLQERGEVERRSCAHGCASGCARMSGHRATGFFSPGEVRLRPAWTAALQGQRATAALVARQECGFGHLLEPKHRVPRVGRVAAAGQAAPAAKGPLARTRLGAPHEVCPYPLAPRQRGTTLVRTAGTGRRLAAELSDGQRGDGGA